MSKKITCLTFCLLALVGLAAGQTPLGVPTLIDATKIVLDSNFNVPDKPLPFDRYFSLQFSVARKVSVLGFALIPIDANGVKVVTQRDYRIYIRSLSSDKEERKLRMKETPFSTFKDPNVEALFFYKQSKVIFKEKKSEVILLIPPLEPRRDYLIRVYFNDDKPLELYMGMNAPLHKVLNMQASIDIAAFTELKKLYDKIDPQLFRADDLFQFISQKSCANDVKLRVDMSDLKPGELAGYSRDVEMRFVFSKGLKPDSQLITLVPSRYLSIKSDHIPKGISLAMITALASQQKLLDADGAAINFQQDPLLSPYHLYLIASGSKSLLSSTVGPQPFGVTKVAKIADLVFLGNDPKVVAWQPLPVISGCKDDQDFLKKLTDIYAYNPAKLANQASPVLNINTYQALMKVATSCPCKEAGILKDTERDDLLKVLGFIYNMPPGYIDRVVTGKASLVKPYELAAENSADEKTNMETNLKAVDMLEGLVRMTPPLVSDAAVRLNLASFVTYLQTLRSTLDSNKTELKKKMTAEVAIRKHYLDSTYSPEPTDVGKGSTEVFNFMTASKFKIVPDFGFVVISNLPKKGLVNDLVPYLGFNINFRSIDKDIPMNKVRNKHWTYYFSFVMGMTLTSIKIPGKREDLFAGNSLMAGFGFRLNNYLKVIGGSVIYKTYSTNPLSDKKSIGSSAFAGLSIDYELKELFGGIKTLFK